MQKSILAFCKKHSLSVRKKCAKEGCKIGLSAFDNHVWVGSIDGDEYRNKAGIIGKICDCLVFVDGAIYVSCAIELKGGSVDVSYAVAQLQGGADAISHVLNTLKLAIKDHRFLPIIIGPVRSAIERKVLGRVKVVFKGKKVPVPSYACGTELSRIISEMSIVL